MRDDIVPPVGIKCSVEPFHFRCKVYSSMLVEQVYKATGDFLSLSSFQLAYFPSLPSSANYIFIVLCVASLNEKKYKRAIRT